MANIPFKDTELNRGKSSQVPIYRVKGLGICARKSALRRYFNTLDEYRLNKLSNDNEGQKG